MLKVNLKRKTSKIESLTRDNEEIKMKNASLNEKVSQVDTDIEDFIADQEKKLATVVSDYQQMKKQKAALLRHISNDIESKR